MTSNKSRPDVFKIDPEASLPELITDFKFFLIYDLDYDVEEVEQFLHDSAGFEFEADFSNPVNQEDDN